MLCQQKENALLSVGTDTDTVKVLILTIPALSEDVLWKDIDFAVFAVLFFSVWKHIANKSVSFFGIFSKERGPVISPWKIRAEKENGGQKLSLFLSPVQHYL